MFLCFYRSVGKAMELSKIPETAETSKFVLIFDKFVDTLNVTNFSNWAHNRKPFQKPYSSSEDKRLEVTFDCIHCWIFVYSVICSGCKKHSSHILTHGKHLLLQEMIVMTRKKNKCF